ncbi:uncharacterized protein B0H64DRAFT_40617 [Chaetomium fimeti]|jgi:hypothetical protein|uniref:Uncharacterized protein n=1 Tax=Chaetomium fimeti TaxID=1854472 RepID=A0AAE0HRR1_9PEZI|nr:hypothetical protein B0H64DRAFT_40617 [Chaetomium fimeti]
MMSSPLKKQPEVVADRVLKRAEISKMARRLQNRLALAQFKTKHNLVNETLDMIEPKFEQEMRRRRLQDGDILSDSSSSASDLPYPSRTLMSSPLKAPLFSDAIGSSNGSTGHRKRTYLASFDDNAFSSPSKRFRQSPTAHRSFSSHHPFIQSSPIKPRRQQHFTTSTGPDLSFYSGSRQISDVLTTTNYAANSDDEDDLPTHSFHTSHVRVSPPRTPPMRSRTLMKKPRDRQPAASESKTGEEGADLLLYLAASPSPANPPRNRMDPPSTPPPKNKLALPSSMMTTPGGGNPYPATPGLGFDFAEFLHMTPSPAQKPWKTPLAGKTPRSVARRRLTFDDIPS